MHTFTVKPTIGGQAVELGVPINVGGSKVTLSQLRFFVTQPCWAARPRPRCGAELVDAAGKPLPYGLALVDLDKPDSLTLRLRAPAGRLRPAVAVRSASTRPATRVRSRRRWSTR